jgi:hypothetical protein
MELDGGWLLEIGNGTNPKLDGLTYLSDFFTGGVPPLYASPEAVSVMERARDFGAIAVFFEASRESTSSVPLALIFCDDGSLSDFASLHRRLWSWGAVPLAYVSSHGKVLLYRCAHGPDFATSPQGTYQPFAILDATSKIDHAWWNAEQLRNGTLWDDPHICDQLLSKEDSAPRSLISAVRGLYTSLSSKGLLQERLRRKLLIITLLIAYLEDRKVLERDFFSQFLGEATCFFDVLADGTALVELLSNLENRFNGQIFAISDEDKEEIKASQNLTAFANFVKGYQTPSGQLTLWKQYSFADLPVELISNIYQLFVEDVEVAVYTPPVLVKLMVSEVLDSARIDRLLAKNEVILDPACGSGVFLVEAFKRLVQHWRATNDWKRPSVETLQDLVFLVHGIDLEEGAVELAAFSLCLALCDALQPEDIRSSIRLFPALQGVTLKCSCFFDAVHTGQLGQKVGVIFGNPPFASELKTSGSRKAYADLKKQGEAPPDKQVAYLFLHHSMAMLEPGGVLAMLQQYNFLYNLNSQHFRTSFFSRWRTRELLDFVSIRGLFAKDTKVIVIVAEASAPTADSKLLHATFRRNGRSNSEQHFDLDYYDMHWVSQPAVQNEEVVWKTHLLGGQRFSDLVARLKTFPSLGSFLDKQQDWNVGQGVGWGGQLIVDDIDHLRNQKYLPPDGLQPDGIDISKIELLDDQRKVASPRTSARFEPPMLLIRQQIDLACDLWDDGHLIYNDKVLGISAPPHDISKLKSIHNWITGENAMIIRAFVAGCSAPALVQRATAVYDADIRAMPFPIDRDLDLTDHEKLVAKDVVDYLCGYVRLGSKSTVMVERGLEGIENYQSIFLNHLNAAHIGSDFVAQTPYSWSGLLCQPFTVGNFELDWTDAYTLRDRLLDVIHRNLSNSVSLTRILRVYDNNVLFVLKPDRLRFWLPSIALRDADEVLADIWSEGY